MSQFFFASLNRILSDVRVFLLIDKKYWWEFFQYNNSYSKITFRNGLIVINDNSTTLTSNRNERHPAVSKAISFLRIGVILLERDSFCSVVLLHKSYLNVSAAPTRFRSPQHRGWWRHCLGSAKRDARPLPNSILESIAQRRFQKLGRAASCCVWRRDDRWGEIRFGEIRVGRPRRWHGDRSQLNLLFVRRHGKSDTSRARVNREYTACVLCNFFILSCRV